MTALVVVETVAVLLLGLLVAGLLRSHAEILRQLHQLGAGYAGERGPAPIGPPLSPVRRDSGGTVDVAGVTPTGAAVSVGVGRPGERTLLLFLSSGCTKCGGFWEAMAQGAHQQLGPGARTLVVTRDADEESPSRLAELAPPGVTVVLSSASWDAYGVPGAPYAVVVGPTAAIEGEGTAGSWEQLMSLLHQASNDSTAGREERADRELLAAGIGPGDPSLYPSPSRPAPPGFSPPAT
jgi:hypothetical protein